MFGLLFWVACPLHPSVLPGLLRLNSKPNGFNSMCVATPFRVRANLGRLAARHAQQRDGLRDRARHLALSRPVHVLRLRIQRSLCNKVTANNVTVEAVALA